MKRFLYFCLIPLVGAAFFLILMNAQKESGQQDYGALILSSEIEGLSIYIDEKLVGVTRKEAQSFNLPAIGVYGEADHELIVRKEISASHEYFFRTEFSFNRYIDVEENPVKRIALFRSQPENDSYPPVNHAIGKRLKPELLARKTGLIQEKKLKHNSSWNMAEDGRRIYVLTRAHTDRYRTSSNEEIEGEFIEVYDKETLSFVAEKQLSYKNDTFSRYDSIAVTGETIYIGDDSGHLLRLDKESLAPQQEKQKLPGFRDKISGLKIHNDYLIAFGEWDRIAVFKADKLLYVIDERDNYPPNIKEIHDYWEYNRINSATVHRGVLYATNFRGFINAYALADGQPLTQINTIKFEEEWDYVVGSNIEAGAVYQERDLYFSIDYNGLLIFDPQTEKRSHIKTLFPEEIVYSEMLQENIDITKSTSIYKMHFYHHYLLFSEVSARHEHVYAYDLNSNKIVHTFKGHRGDISELFLQGNHLTGLSTEGLLYRWDLAVLGQDASADVIH